jgi:hypothetical protein
MVRMRGWSYEIREATKSNATALPLSHLAVDGGAMFMPGSIGAGRSLYFLQMADDLDLDTVVHSHNPEHQHLLYRHANLGPKKK